MREMSADSRKTRAKPPEGTTGRIGNPTSRSLIDLGVRAGTAEFRRRLKTNKVAARSWRALVEAGCDDEELARSVIEASDQAFLPFVALSKRWRVGMPKVAQDLRAIAESVQQDADDMMPVFEALYGEQAARALGAFPDYALGLANGIERAAEMARQVIKSGRMPGLGLAILHAYIVAATDKPHWPDVVTLLEIAGPESQNASARQDDAPRQACRRFFKYFPEARPIVETAISKFENYRTGGSKIHGEWICNLCQQLTALHVKPRDSG